MTFMSTSRLCVQYTRSPFSCVLCNSSSYNMNALYSPDSFAPMIFQVGLISSQLSSGGEQTAHREEVQRLRVWRSADNLLLDTSRSEEMVMDWRRKG